MHQWDPRLSTGGNRIARRLGILLDATTKMNHWLRFTGRSELQACGLSGLGKTHLIQGVGRKCCALRYLLAFAHILNAVKESDLPCEQLYACNPRSVHAIQLCQQWLGIHLHALG